MTAAGSWREALLAGLATAGGSWYCPAMPEPLISATAGLRDHATGRDTYDAQIAARAPYRLKRKDGPDADGYQRLSCPALGGHPGLMCPTAEPEAPPGGHADGGPASATTSQTADGHSSQRRHPAPAPAAGQPRPGTTGSRATRPPASSNRPAAAAPGRQTPEPYSKNGHHHSSAGTTPAVLSVTPGRARRDSNPQPSDP